MGGAHKGFGEANLKNKGLRGANLENKGFGGANLIKKSLLTQKRSLRAGKTYGKPIFGVGFDLIKNLWENL